MESSNLMLYNLTPGLLDRDTIIKILNDRCIDLPNMRTMSKDELVALFHRVVAPLPQRTRSTEQPEPMPLTQGSQGFAIGFSSATKSPSFHPKSRLKPPPDVSSTHKTVKLSTTKPQCSSHLENIIIHDRRKKSVQNDMGKSKHQSISCANNGVNVLDKIVINDRTTKAKRVSEDTPTGSTSTIEQISRSSDIVTHSEGGDVHNLNLKPRIKLKRPSLSASSGPECSSLAVEPEVKKPKTKIVF